MVFFFAAATLFLQSSAPATVAVRPHNEAERSADPASKVICKRFTETGSLVSAYRVCKTKADWERERDNLRQTTTSQSCAALGQGGSCN